MRDVTKKMFGDAAHKGKDFSNLIEYVFPLVKLSDDNQLEFIGTGFFVANFGVFATAKHVVEDALNRPDNRQSPLMMIHFLNSKDFILRAVTMAVYPKIGDVALCLAEQYISKETKRLLENKVLHLTTRVPGIGEAVITYAYPNTIIDANHMHTSPSLYDGNITAYYPAGRDRVMLPKACYETSMALHGGSSGGPVFCESGGVFGINSTGYGNKRISYVSSINELFSLNFPKGSIEGLNTPSVISIPELAKYGQAYVSKN